LYQTGNANVASVDQRDAAKSNVEQGNFSASHDNNATVKQLAGSVGSISDVNQNGANNMANVTQSGANSDSFTYQYNGKNDATVVQSGAKSVNVLIQYEGNVPVTTGPKNEAFVTQTGADTYSYLAQGGKGNVANVTLSGTGDANPRRATSQEYTTGATGVAAESEVWQEGLSNKATVDQISNSSTARVYQGTGYPGYSVPGGTSNEATIRQYAGSDNSRADIYQDGDLNKAVTTQTAASSTALVFQNGTDNFSSVDQQSGSGHSATVTQAMAGNDSWVTQNGTGNSATVGQYSANNQSTVTQGGNGNTAAVTQGSH
jgi:hypothetical protein